MHRRILFCTYFRERDTTSKMTGEETSIESSPIDEMHRTLTEKCPLTLKEKKEKRTTLKDELKA